MFFILGHFKRSVAAADMNFYKGKVLSPIQLKRLSEHKYSSESLSLLDSWLQPWWNWLVGTVPPWVAPNLITIVGLIINIVTTLVLVWYSPDAKSEAPRWAFVLCALGLFAYQSLDAIDGKQARRTGSTSPVGELFDHGCDSVSTVFVAISACIAVRLGAHPSWMFFQCFCALTLFYCAHWQAYVSGTVKFGRVDVTEAQFTIILIHLISAVFGPGIWSNKIPFLGVIHFYHLIVSMTIVCGSRSLYDLLIVISNGGVGKNGSTVAGTSVLSPVIALSLVVVPALMISMKSDSLVYENHPVLYIMAFGLVAAKVTNRLVVAHMTRNEMCYVDTSMIGPTMLFFNQYFNYFIPEYIVLWVCLIFVCADLLWYSWQVCHEICDHMKIQLFRIVPTNPSTNKNGMSSVTNTRQARSRRHYH